MTRKVRARISSLSDVELSRITLLYRAYRSYHDPTDRKEFLAQQSEQHQRTISQINKVEREAHTQLKEEYRRTYGHNGSQPQIGYFLAIIARERGI